MGVSDPALAATLHEVRRSLALSFRQLLDLPLALLLLTLNGLARSRSKVGAGPFFDPERFDWIPAVEAHSAAIRRELEQLLQARDHIPTFQEVSPPQRALTQDDKWKTYFLIVYGHEVEANCAQCPRTFAALRHIPGLKTAMFSILAPHKRIPPHRGPFGGLLRYHLGLVIPERRDQLGIRVGDETRSWQAGKSLVFDDSWEHEAWNDSDQERVVLFVDFVRPLDFPIDRLCAASLRWLEQSQFVKEALERIQGWNERFPSARRTS